MRVVIVADGQLAAEAVRGCLASVPTMKVVGFLDSRRPWDEVLSLVGHDLVVVYADAPTSPSATLLEKIREASESKIVLLTGDMDSDWLHDACERGADAVVSVSVGTTGLGALIRQVAAGAVFHPMMKASKPAAIDHRHGDLTTRELEILRLVAAGASNGQVAMELWVTEQTVKFHLSNTYRKLGVANRTEAAHYAHTHGLLAPERQLSAVAA